MPVTTLSRQHFNTPIAGSTGWGVSGWGTGHWGDPYAPTEAFTVGTQVGVPTGTSLVATTGMPTQDAIESLTLTHPITGQVATRTVKVWRRRQWSSVLTVSPGVGETWLFDECKFAGDDDPWVFGIGEDNARLDVMDPLFVFRRCEFNGNSTTGIGVGGSFAWLINSHIAGTFDGWQGGAYSVGIESNIVGYGATIDQHADGFQCTGDGRINLYRCWLSVSGVGQSSCFAVGTESGSVTGVNVYYCGISGGGWAVSVQPSGGNTVSNVAIVSNRWTRTAEYGPASFGTINGTYTWSDNAFFDGEVIPQPD